MVLLVKQSVGPAIQKKLMILWCYRFYQIHSQQLLVDYVKRRFTGFPPWWNDNSMQVAVIITKGGFYSKRYPDLKRSFFVGVVFGLLRVRFRGTSLPSLGHSICHLFIWHFV